jgi:primosomal protein N' (replication factor Y)
MPAPDAPLVVRVLPEVAGLTKTFDYLVPSGWEHEVAVGTEVRVALHGRRVGGWVVARGVEPPPGVRLQPLAKVRGHGPAPELVELATWAARRWAGRPAQFLRTASAPTAVHAVDRRPARPVPEVVVPGAPGEGLVDDALDRPVSVVRLPPGADRFGFLATVAGRGLRGAVPASSASASTAEPANPAPSVLVVCPSIDAARRLAVRLRRTGLPVALVADDRRGSAASTEWARAAGGGCVVVGARAASWAPAPGLTLAVVVDEHDEALQEERVPTWHARDVVLERARRAGAVAVLLSPVPSLEALDAGALLVPPRRVERAGWPVLDIVDRRREDPATASSLVSSHLAGIARGDGRVVCVLNRTGRARLLACRSCGELARCEACGAAVEQPEPGLLRCRRCGQERPVVCLGCGSTAMRVARAGVGRVREELETLLGERVAEVTAAGGDDGLAAARVVIGTEAVLHRVGRADVVAFLDIDQELTAPRYRAAEQALGLVARAARLLGGREATGRLVVQTRLPEHPVLDAVLHADPGRLVGGERAMRQALRFPPAAALALVSGAGAETFVEGLRQAAADGPGVDLLGPTDGTWLVRAPDHDVLAAALGAAPRPPGRVRVAVDPLRI